MSKPRKLCDENNARIKEAWDSWAQIEGRLEILSTQQDSDRFYKVEPHSSLAGDDCRSHPFEVSHIIGASLVTAIDYLNGMHALVRHSPALTIHAPQALARSAIECAVVGLWILVPRNRDERVTRALRWWFQDSLDLSRAKSEYGRDGHERFRERLRQLAEKEGIDPNMAVKKYTITCALKDVIESRPQLENVRYAWQLGSGFAHGRVWTMLEGLSQEPVDEDDSVAKFRMTNTITGTEYFATQALLAIQELSDLRDLRAMISS